MNYLTKLDFVSINRETVKAHGGQFIEPNNLLNGGPLDYLIEAVQSRLFGEEVYPTITDKAALYMFSVISNHIFSDGNKRTGLAAGIVFLQLNNMRLNKKLSKVEIFDFTIKVASGLSSLEECQAWFKENAVPI